MAASSFYDANLCILHRISSKGDHKVICQISKNKTTALILFLIGISFIGTGLYLLLSGIGTIPSFSMGCTMTIAGLGLFVGGNFLFLKTACADKK